MLDSLARVRLWLVVLALSIGGVVELGRQLEPGTTFDPAWMFYFGGAFGMGLRVFFARYLALCFVAALTAVTFFWGSMPLGAFAFCIPMTALLAGRRMRALFEGSEGRFNRWATGVDRRIARLRVLFVAQAVAMALLWAAADRLAPCARALSVAAGISLAGLVLQHTWGALALAPILVAEVGIALSKAGVHVHRGTPPGWAFTAVLVVSASASAVVIAPLVAGFGKKLRDAVTSP